MGSLRNPVGPLPSSIYWRRRTVLFALVALIAVLVAWAVTTGGGGGGKGSSAPTGSHSPAATITAGPAPTGTHITGRPGGRDTAPADGGTASNGGTGDGTSAGTTAGTTAGASAGDSAGTAAGATSAGASAGTAAGASAGTSGGSAGSGSGGASAGTGAGGDQVPVGSTLPNCSPGTVSLSLASEHNSYAPGEAPVFQLRATNSGAVTCKLDFGPRSAVFTVTKTPDDNHVWASNDCPDPAHASPYLLQVPAHGTTTYTLHWNAKTSSPKCAAPKGAQAAPGNYLAQAQLPGYGAKNVPFVLSQD